MQYRIEWPQRYGQPKPSDSRLVSCDGKVTDQSEDIEWAARLPVGEVVMRLNRAGAIVEVVSASCKPLPK